MKVSEIKQSGFTFIETIIVIVIVGIIALVAVPQFNRTISNKRLFDAAEKLRDDIEYCRDYATSQRTNTWIDFNIPLNQYRLFSGNTLATRTPLIDPSRQNNAAYVISSGNLGIDLPGVSLVSSSFPISGGIPVVSFNWWGTPNAGGNVIITNVINTITITVSPQTGYVQ